jgi:hypothetical protein
VRRRARKGVVGLDAPHGVAAAVDGAGIGGEGAAALDHGGGAGHEEGGRVAPPGVLEAGGRLGDELASGADGEGVDEAGGGGVRATEGGEDEGVEAPTGGLAGSGGLGLLPLDVRLERVDDTRERISARRTDDPDINRNGPGAFPEGRGAKENISGALEVSVRERGAEGHFEARTGVGGASESEEVVTESVMAEDAATTSAGESVGAEIARGDRRTTLVARAGAVVGGDGDAEAEASGGDVLVGREDGAVGGVDAPEPVVRDVVAGDILESTKTLARVAVGGGGELERVDDGVTRGLVEDGEDAVLELGGAADGAAIGFAITGILHHVGRGGPRRGPGGGGGPLTEDGRIVGEDGGGAHLLDVGGDGIAGLVGVDRAEEGVDGGGGASGVGGVRRGTRGAEPQTLTREPDDEVLRLDERRDVGGPDDGCSLAETEATSANPPGGLLGGVITRVDADDATDGVAHEGVEGGERRKGEGVEAVGARADSAEEVDDLADLGGGTGEDQFEGRVVELGDGVVQSGGLVDLLGELGGGVAEADAEPLDGLVVGHGAAGGGGIGRDSVAIATATNERLGGAAADADPRAGEVPRGEPEVAIEGRGTDAAVVDVPDVGDAQRAGGDGGPSIFGGVPGGRVGKVARREDAVNEGPGLRGERFDER